MINILHQDASVMVNRFYIRVVLIIWMLMILMDPITELALLDPRLLNLKGIPLCFFPDHFKPILLNITFLYFLKGTMLMCLLCRLLNKFPRLSMTIATLFITMHQALVRSFSYSNHAELSILLALYAILISDWANHSLKDKKVNINVNGLPLIMTFLMMSVAYMLIGMKRIVVGQADIFTTDTILQFSMRNANQWDSELARTCLNVVLQNEWLKIVVKAGFFVTTVFEVFAPLALIVRPFRHMFIFIMMGFHFMCWLLMAILFWQNMILLIFFFDLTYWFKRWGWDRS